jgi:hypothetical protein
VLEVEYDEEMAKEME